MNQKQKILVVDDEAKIVEIVSLYLENDGYHVITAANGKDALDLYQKEKPSLIILDLMMPELTGEEVCEIIRKESNVPIIMLTAKSDENDKIKGLSMGADDYLIKPFSPRELVIRVQNILRRVQQQKNPIETLSYNDGNLIIDPHRHEILLNNVVVELTPIEFRILLVLAQNSHKTFSRSELLEKVQGYTIEGYDRTIDAHIKNLRKKIEDDQKKSSYIKTVYGVGYKFDSSL